jgi:hypothetical protein
VNELMRFIQMVLNYMVYNQSQFGCNTHLQPTAHTPLLHRDAILLHIHADWAPNEIEIGVLIQTGRDTGDLHPSVR